MKFIRYISVLLTAAAFAGCLKDRTEGCDPANGQIVIQIKTPESFASRSQTRALNADKEMGIRVLDILVFEDRGGSETFMYHVVPTHIRSATDPAVQYFTATLQTSKNSEKQRLVLLANMPDDCRSKLADISEGMDKQTALDLLVFEAGMVFEESMVWTADDLPMWGESDRSVVVTERTTGGAFGTIQMLYSMARIDVGFKANDDWTAFQGLPGYELMEVHLINTNKAGYMAPHKANLVAGLPTIPTAAEGNDALLSQSFSTEFEPPYRLPSTGAMHLIYSAEYANKGKSSDELSYLLIVVRNNATMSDSWYRIDFYKRGEAITEIERLDLLRGHLYKVNIKGVDGPGYSSREEAMSSITTLLDAEVTVWNERDIETGLEAGKEEYYKLSVSQANFVFNGMARDKNDSNNKVAILTDYLSGWRVSAITEIDDDGNEQPAGSWLRTDANSGNRNEWTAVSLLVEDYDSTVPRRGRIYIEAGKWTYTINVEQKLGTLSVSPETIDLKFDHVQVPLAEARLTMDTQFGWMLDRIEYDEEQMQEDDFEPWLSVFDPDLDLSNRDPFDLFRKEFDLQEGEGELRESRHAYLRVDANTTESVRTATVWFMNEEGLEASVEVRQGWIECGTGGVPKIRQIGEREYATHIYGTNIRKIGESMIDMGYFKRMSELPGGDPQLEKNAITYIQQIPNEYAISCFMVENSWEGSWDFQYYANNSDVATGPYYRYETAADACPPGWRLPKQLDVNNIEVCNAALSLYGLNYFTPDYQLWATTNTFTGYGIKEENFVYWDNLGTGYYHGARFNDGGTQYEAILQVDKAEGSPAGVYISINKMPHPNNNLLPVRCVEDVNPYDYPMMYE